MKQKEQRKVGKLGWILGLVGVLAIVIAVVVIVSMSGKKKEVYRTIRVTEVLGEVTLNREDLDDLEVKENMNLLSGDEVRTGDGAKMTLRVDDDKYIVVDENTKLLLYADGTEEDSKTRIELEYGAVFTDIKKKLSEDSDYEVVCPSSVMSVRGTQFEVVYRELRDKNGAAAGKEMKILTFEGSVEVAPEGKAEARLSAAGTIEVLAEENGEYKFDGATRPLKAADLSGMSAMYLKEDISEHYDEMSEEEQKWKKELLDMAEEYLEGCLDDHFYQFVPLEGRTWEEMKAYCEENGGHLATILSVEENDFLYQKMVEEGYDYAYFGCTDEAAEGEWKWVTGDALNYENWYAPDVDNFREEDYAMLWMQRPGYWNDGGLRESTSVAFICEWDVVK